MGLPLFAIYRWRDHVNLFMEIAMEKSIFYIQLMERPIFSYSNSKNTADSNKFCNWSKGVTIVKTFNLSVNLGHKTSLMMLNGSIGLKFCFENPFVANWFLTRRKRCEGPCMVSFQGLELSSHGLTPMRVMHTLGICSGIRLMRKGSKKSIMIVRKTMIRKEGGQGMGCT